MRCGRRRRDLVASGVQRWMLPPSGPCPWLPPMPWIPGVPPGFSPWRLVHQCRQERNTPNLLCVQQVIQRVSASTSGFLSRAATPPPPARARSPRMAIPELNPGCRRPPWLQLSVFKRTPPFVFALSRTFSVGPVAPVAPVAPWSSSMESSPRNSSARRWVKVVPATAPSNRSATNNLIAFLRPEGVKGAKGGWEECVCVRRVWEGARERAKRV
jgi:hypothetical protein